MDHRVDIYGDLLVADIAPPCATRTAGPLHIPCTVVPTPTLVPGAGIHTSLLSAFTLLPTNFGAQNSCQHFLISCNVPHTALPCAERAPSLVHMPCAGAPTPALAPGARVRTKTLLVVKLVLTTGLSLSGFLWIFLAHAQHVLSSPPCLPSSTS